MSFLFKTKPKTPQELVRNTKEAINKLHSSSDKRKVNKIKFCYKNIIYIFYNNISINLTMISYFN